MEIKNVLASVAVKDLGEADKWYQKVFRRAPDARPMAEVAEWKFPRGGWLQVYQLPERAGRCSCTFAVDDLNEWSAHLKQLGISVGEVMESDKTRVIMVTDPDGNSLAFAEALDPSMAR